MALAAIVGQKLLGRTGTRTPLVLGIVFLAAGLFTFVHLPADGTYVPNILPGMELTAIGVGLSLAGWSRRARIRSEKSKTSARTNRCLAAIPPPVF